MKNLIGKNSSIDVSFCLKMANRHGCITGATGTGKTITLQVLAELFSDNGVPVFMADVKGDLTGLAEPGQPNQGFLSRVAKNGFTKPTFKSYPVKLFDVYQECGYPITTTIEAFGNSLLSSILELNNTQSGVLSVCFKIAQDEGFFLTDLESLRELLQYVYENNEDIGLRYGNVSRASIGAIQRQLLTLEGQGGNHFFSAVCTDVESFIDYSGNGRGFINILQSERLIQNPLLYGVFLLWLLDGLYNALPEQGDADKPKFVFFFDEAHLLFNNASKILLRRVEQIVRLIRSKGVGVYFVTQSPSDIPDNVLGQLGNRIQHALRAYTPKDQRAVKTAVDTMVLNPELNMQEAIKELGVGEALVSLLDDVARPIMSQRVFIKPPSSKIGPCSDEVLGFLMPIANEHVSRETSIAIHYSKILLDDFLYICRGVGWLFKQLIKI